MDFTTMFFIVSTFFAKYFGAGGTEPSPYTKEYCQALEQEKAQWLTRVTEMEQLLTTLNGASAQNRALIERCLQQSEELLTMERSSYDQIKSLAQSLESK